MVKLIKNGKNLYCRIPREVVQAAGLTKETQLLVNYDRISGRIILEKINA
ncbi:MAG: hypothetical protein V1494_00635 [Candidatus Diapherotrites archaeon]